MRALVLLGLSIAGGGLFAVARSGREPAETVGASEARDEGEASGTEALPSGRGGPTTRVRILARDALSMSGRGNARALARAALDRVEEARDLSAGTEHPSERRILELYREAASSAKRALAEDPGSRDAALALLFVTFDDHRFAAAAEGALELLRRHPADAGVLALLGDARLELGDSDGAAEAYQAMVDAKPSAAAYGRIGYLRLRWGDLEGAVELLPMALDATPPEPRRIAWALCDLGEAWLDGGEYEAALDAFQAALRSAPTHARAHLGAGLALHMEGDEAGALGHYEAAARFAPTREHLALLERSRAGAQLQTGVHEPMTATSR